MWMDDADDGYQPDISVDFVHPTSISDTHLISSSTVGIVGCWYLISLDEIRLVSAAGKRSPELSLCCMIRQHEELSFTLSASLARSRWARERVLFPDTSLTNSGGIRVC